MLAERETKQRETAAREIECGGMATTLVLRGRTGWDEHALDATADPGVAAHRLLQRVGSEADGTPLNLDAMPVALLDRLLAELHITLYGEEAQCQAQCTTCAETFEFTLNLRELMAFQDRDRPGSPDEDGAWTLDDGRRVRAPLDTDLVPGAPASTLGQSLMVQGIYADDPDAVDAFLDRAAPLLALDMPAACALCGAPQTIRFDLARYLGSRLLESRRTLLSEVHLVASAYQWAHGEILDLPQADRQALVSMIRSDRSAAALRVPR